MIRSSFSPRYVNTEKVCLKITFLLHLVRYQIIIIYLEPPEDKNNVFVVVTNAVSADGAQSQEEEEEEEALFPPLSSTVPRNPSEFQEKDQNLKYVFNSIN